MEREPTGDMQMGQVARGQEVAGRPRDIAQPLPPFSLQQQNRHPRQSRGQGSPPASAGALLSSTATGPSPPRKTRRPVQTRGAGVTWDTTIANTHSHLRVSRRRAEKPFPKKADPAALSETGHGDLGERGVGEPGSEVHCALLSTARGFEFSHSRREGATGAPLWPLVLAPSLFPRGPVPLRKEVIH